MNHTGSIEMLAEYVIHTGLSSACYMMSMMSPAIIAGNEEGSNRRSYCIVKSPILKDIRFVKGVT